MSRTRPPVLLTIPDSGTWGKGSYNRENNVSIIYVKKQCLILKSHLLLIPIGKPKEMHFGVIHNLSNPKKNMPTFSVELTILRIDRTTKQNKEKEKDL